MSFNREQFKDLIERTLKYIDLYSENAIYLLMGTAAQESRFGTDLVQMKGGPAKGVFQIEPATAEDAWNNYLGGKSELSVKIMGLRGDSNAENEEDDLEWNLAYGICQCRVKYLRDPKPLPDKDDIVGMAKYWKRVYNTNRGRGTKIEFVNNYHTYVMPCRK